VGEVAVEIPGVFGPKIVEHLLWIVPLVYCVVWIRRVRE
jgi:hypothetical protein